MSWRGRKDTIDVERGLELRDEGLSWREIGIQLARDAGRSLPYQTQAVRDACQPTPARVSRMLARDIARAR